MTEQPHNPHNALGEEPLTLDKLPARSVFVEVLYGIAIMSGLALLWGLESIRNAFFRLLDKMNIRPRVRRASAFPPGPSREHTTVAARR
jgi:hypothetical protein